MYLASRKNNEKYLVLILLALRCLIKLVIKNPNRYFALSIKIPQTIKLSCRKKYYKNILYSFLLACYGKGHGRIKISIYTLKLFDKCIFSIKITRMLLTIEKLGCVRFEGLEGNIAC